MEPIEKMLVSLDPGIGEDILLKRTQGTYMDKKVEALLEYMLDPNNDDLNPGYNTGERRVADVIKAWRTKALNNPDDKFVLAAKPIDGSDIIPLNLDDMLLAYKSRILQSRPVPGKDPSVTMPYIELFASYEEGGHVLRFPIKLG